MVRPDHRQCLTPEGVGGEYDAVVVAAVVAGEVAGVEEEVESNQCKGTGSVTSMAT